MFGDKYYIGSLHWTASGYAFAFVLLRRQENVWARSSSCYVLGGTGWVHVFLVRRGRKIRLVLGCYKKNPSFQRIERKTHLVLEGWPNLGPSFQRRERKIHLVLGHWSFLDLLVLCEQLVFLYLPRKAVLYKLIVKQHFQLKQRRSIQTPSWPITHQDRDMDSRPPGCYLIVLFWKE